MELDKEHISEYVERVFELYGINKHSFFVDYDEEADEDVIISLFDENREDVRVTLNRISLFLGLSVQEIVSMDRKAAFRYWKKFPFFALYNEFVEKWIWNAQYKSDRPSVTEWLLSRLFQEDIPLEYRYSFDMVQQRLLKKLKELAAFDESYYLPDARLHILGVKTTEFFSFPKCEEMIRSYIEMVKRAQYLFFKAVHSDLSEAEANEYNFLVAYLDIHDICRPTLYLFYPTVADLRDVFLEEGYKEFWSYARIGTPFTIESPWRCSEFLRDRELAQEFVNLFPEAKGKMREFATLAENYYIKFRWEKIKTQEQLDEELVAAYIEGREYDPDEHPEPVDYVYLEKTPEEKEEFSAALKALRKAASPPSMGGLKLPVREYTPGPEVVKRILRRMARR